jgi:hypothetical protein
VAATDGNQTTTTTTSNTTTDQDIGVAASLYNLVSPPVDRRIPSRRFVPVQPVVSDTLCHRLSVATQPSNVNEDWSANTAECPNGIQRWILDFPLPTDPRWSQGPTGVLLIQRALAQWARSVNHRVSETKVYIDDRDLQEAVVAGSLVQWGVTPVARNVMWFNPWFTGSEYTLSPDIDRYVCGGGSSPQTCNTMCRVPQVVANVSRERLSKALCSPACICAETLQMHWTDLLPRMFQPATWGQAEPYAPGVNRMLQNMAVMNTTAQYWKPAARSAIAKPDIDWWYRSGVPARQIYLDIWW